MQRPTVSWMLIAVWSLAITMAGTMCAPSQPGNDSGDSPSEGYFTEQAVIIGSEVPGGLSHFTVTGTNEDFGRYLALGEGTFLPGQEEGVLQDGTGIAVLKAQNGDQIVADVTCRVSGDGIDFTFHWRDSVTFSTGSTASNTGAFVDERPPGLVLRRTRLSAVYIDGLCCIDCCTSGGLCSNYCNFCGGASPTCPDGTTKTRQ